MIYTVTLNPSLDYLMALPVLEPGAINRSLRERILPGGKGINVSQVLKALGLPSRAVYFSAGFTGSELTRLLREAGLEPLGIPLSEGLTRINVKAQHESGETALNAAGPAVDASALAALEAELSVLTEGDILVLSGKLPPRVPENLYARLGALAARCGAEFVVDTEGEALLQALAQHPLLVKPNREELEAVWGRAVFSYEDALEGAGFLRQFGARNVLVSLGAEGAVLLTEEQQAFKSQGPHVDLCSTVGAGDALLAAFLFAVQEGRPKREALRWAVAAGTATVGVEGLALHEEIYALLPEARVENL